MSSLRQLSWVYYGMSILDMAPVQVIEEAYMGALLFLREIGETNFYGDTFDISAHYVTMAFCAFEYVKALSFVSYLSYILSCMRLETERSNRHELAAVECVLSFFGYQKYKIQILVG